MLAPGYFGNRMEVNYSLRAQIRAHVHARTHAHTGARTIARVRKRWSAIEEYEHSNSTVHN